MSKRDAGVDLEIVWRVITEAMPDMVKRISEME